MRGLRSCSKRMNLYAAAVQFSGFEKPLLETLRAYVLTMTCLKDLQIAINCKAVTDFPDLSQYAIASIDLD